RPVAAGAGLPGGEPRHRGGGLPGVRADGESRRRRMGLDQVRPPGQLRAGGDGGVARARQRGVDVAEGTPLLLVLVYRSHEPTITIVASAPLARLDSVIGGRGGGGPRRLGPNRISAERRQQVVVTYQMQPPQ